MKLDRKEFVKALESVMPGTSARSIVVGADRVSFHKNRLYTTNGLISMMSAFSTEEPLECAVNASDLLTTLKRLDADEVDVALEKDHLRIKAGRSKANLGIFELQRNSALWMAKPVYIEMPSDYYDALEYCVIPGNKYPLSGAFFSGNAAMSTDGKRINYVKLSMDSPQFWINDQCAKVILKAGNVFTSFAVEQGEVFFSSDNLTVAVKRLNDEAYRAQAIKEYYEMCGSDEGALPIPSGLAEAIQRAAPFIEDDEKISPVKLLVHSEGIEVSSKHGTDAYEELVEFPEPIELEAKSIIVDYNMLVHALKKCDRFVVKDISKGQYNYRMIVLFGMNSTVILNAMRGE